MSERVGLNPKWFEPGKNFKTMFGEHVRKNRMRGISVEECISAAFRALLAEDEAQETPALQVGDVVRLDDPAQMCCEQFIGVQATITGFREDGNPYYTSSRGDSWWPLSACTLVRRAGEAAPVGKVVPVPEIVTPKVAEFIIAKDAEIARLTAEIDEASVDAHADEIAFLRSELHARNDEIVGLRAEVERLEEIVKDTNNVLDVMTRDLAAERDALQAQISNLEGVQ